MPVQALDNCFLYHVQTLRTFALRKLPCTAVRMDYLWRTQTGAWAGHLPHTRPTLQPLAGQHLLHLGVGIIRADRQYHLATPRARMRTHPLIA